MMDAAYAASICSWWKRQALLEESEYYISQGWLKPDCSTLDMNPTTLKAVYRPRFLASPGYAALVRAYNEKLHTLIKKRQARGYESLFTTVKDVCVSTYEAKAYKAYAGSIQAWLHATYPGDLIERRREALKCHLEQWKRSRTSYNISEATSRTPALLADGSVWHRGQQIAASTPHQTMLVAAYKENERGIEHLMDTVQEALDESHHKYYSARLAKQVALSPEQVDAVLHRLQQTIGRKVIGGRYKDDTLLALQVFNRFANEWGVRVEDAIAVFYKYATGIDV